MVGRCKLVCFLFITIFVLGGCTFSNFPNKLRGKVDLCPTANNQLNTKAIKLDGYYYKPKTDGAGSYHQFFVFYKDGYCSYSLVRENIDTFLIKVNTKRNKSEYDDYYNRGYWGKYQIKNDTAYLVMTNHPSSMSPSWDIIEQKMCIREDFITKHSIRLLIDRNANYCDTNSFKPSRAESKYTFKQYSNLPNSSLSWIKKSVCK